jgi:hypothetical protein
MSVFELTAKSQMYLGDGNVVKKGEKITMNIHSLTAQPYNLFSTPENRRQAIQQFGVHGIEAKQGSPVLNVGNWDVKRIPTQTLYRSIETPMERQIEKFHFPWQEMPNRVLDQVEMKKSCIDHVSQFFNEGKHLDYSEKGLEGRCKIAHQFYDGIKQEMDIDAKLIFDPTMPPNVKGGFDPSSNTITLNARDLCNPNCKDLLNTILHESLHASDKRGVDNPELTTMDKKTLDAIKYNFDHYIRPEDDFVGYENQLVEMRANYFADSVMKYGIENTQYA